MWRLAAILSLMAQTATANMTCAGTGPDWTLDLTGTTGDFAFHDRRSLMDIPQRSTTEGADWPQAMTLIGPRDSAVVLLDQKSCGVDNIAAYVLTQRGETPVLLTGYLQRD